MRLVLASSVPPLQLSPSFNQAGSLHYFSTDHSSCRDALGAPGCQRAFLREPGMPSRTLQNKHAGSRARPVRDRISPLAGCALGAALLFYDDLSAQAQASASSPTSLRSAPAEKMPPAPVMMIARSDACWRKRRKVAASSSIVACDNEFICAARLMVMIAAREGSLTRSCWVWW